MTPAKALLEVERAGKLSNGTEWYVAWIGRDIDIAIYNPRCFLPLPELAAASNNPPTG